MTVKASSVASTRACRCLSWPIRSTLAISLQPVKISWTNSFWPSGWIRTTDPWRIWLALPMRSSPSRGPIRWSCSTRSSTIARKLLSSCVLIRSMLLRQYRMLLAVKSRAISGIRQVQGKDTDFLQSGPQSLADSCHPKDHLCRRP